ncbi:hypothetical protein BMF77_03185 [Dolichospermum sp. UHCC 0315A]|jgi:hypothetical protein|nr:hypothetical protein BMF77_03185 [Dolichospermum sp. UHCC 0315A]
MKSFLLKPEQKNLNDVSVTINIMVKVLPKYYPDGTHKSLY